MRLLQPRSRWPVAITVAVLTGGSLLAAGPATASAAARPSITSVGPSPAKAGATAVITGTGFTKVTMVSIHGASARYKVLSAEKIAATVPARATSGLVRVTAGSFTATSPKILPLTATVTSFTPTSGGVGTAVTINGTGFTKPCSLSFNSAAATCIFRSSTKITTAVPQLATTGPISVTTAGSTVTTSSSFTVTLGLNLAGTSGPPSSVITVSGTAFDSDELVDLYVGETDEALVATNASGAFVYAGFVIPASTQPGTVWVSAVGRRSGLAAQEPFTVRTNWPESGFGPAHRGTNPYENTLDTSNVGGIDRLWSYKTGNSVYSSPAIVNGFVYVGSEDDDVYAVNATTGAKLWSYPTGSAVTTSPTVVNGVVYVGSGDDVYALNATTGVELWTYPTGGAVPSPAVVNGVVYVGSADGDVYAVNATTGAKLWSSPTGGAVTTSPAVVNGVVYVGSGGGDVYALNATTGAKLWSYATGDAVFSSPAVVDGLVYVGSEDDDVYALNAATGAELWSYTTSNSVYSSPAVVNGVVYVGSYDDNVYALNAATGAELWSYTTSSLVDSSPAVVDGVVYVGSVDGNVYALNATTGADLWSYATGSAVESSPAVVNGVVYVGSDDGNLYAFSLAGALADVVAQRVRAANLRPNLALKQKGTDR
jgi:outer membrane protein assembly factor BamB